MSRSPVVALLTWIGLTSAALAAPPAVSGFRLVTGRSDTQFPVATHANLDAGDLVAGNTRWDNDGDGIFFVETHVGFLWSPTDGIRPFEEAANVYFDDNRQFVEMLRATLEDAGFEVVSAYSGLAVADLIEREDVDLMILDVLMPGLSGDAVAALLSGAKPHLPVLLMTGDSGDQFVHAVGFPVLHKPFTEQHLLEAVRRLVGS